MLLNRTKATGDYHQVLLGPFVVEALGILFGCFLGKALRDLGPKARKIYTAR